MRHYVRRILRVEGAGQMMLRRMTAGDWHRILQTAFGNSLSSYKKGRAILHSIFAHGIRHEWADANPVDKIDVPHIKETPIRPLSLEEVERLRRTAQRPEHRDMELPLHLMLYCGIRPTEVQRLRPEDIDWKHRQVIIRPQTSKTGGGRVVPLRIRRNINRALPKRINVAVLLSCGLDSTTALHWAHANHQVVCALAFDYGSNHAARELACARWQAEHLGIPYHRIDITAISQHLSSALLSGADVIPTGDYAEENLKQTVVPFRNGIFLAIAAGIAESNGAEAIVIAAHNGDHALFPDCREDFMAAMADAIRLGTYAQLQILRPFIHNTKAEITATGATLGVDFSHTYSCYKGPPQHCGQCATCRERKESFLAAHVQDPTLYM